MIPFLMTKRGGLWWAFPMKLVEGEHAGDCDGEDCRGLMKPAPLPLAWAFTERGLRRKVMRNVRAVAEAAMKRAVADQQKAASESLGG